MTDDEYEKLLIVGTAGAAAVIIIAFGIIIHFLLK